MEELIGRTEVEARLYKAGWDRHAADKVIADLFPNEGATVTSNAEGDPGDDDGSTPKGGGGH